jgi:acyl-CoA reductase-like NAD-dependent aldehyde dehydrogenase
VTGKIIGKFMHSPEELDVSESTDSSFHHRSVEFRVSLGAVTIILAWSFPVYVFSQPLGFCSVRFQLAQRSLETQLV